MERTHSDVGATRSESMMIPQRSFYLGLAPMVFALCILPAAALAVDPSRGSVPTAPPARPSAAESINLRRTVTVQVVERTKNAVVYISTTKLVDRRISPWGDDPFWHPFERGDTVRVPTNSLGSGFIIHPD